MAIQDELQQFRNIVREENRETERRLKEFVKEEVGIARKETREMGNTLLEAIEINGQEEIQLEKRVERIEKHLDLPPVK